MIWTERTGGGKEEREERRRMLTLVWIWSMLEDLEIRIRKSGSGGQDLNHFRQSGDQDLEHAANTSWTSSWQDLMATDQLLKDDRQLVQMAF